MRSLRDYVLETHPAAVGNEKLINILIGMQQFNPNLPADVESPPLEVMDWRDAEKWRGRGRSMARTLLAMGDGIKPYWEDQLKGDMD